MLSGLGAEAVQFQLGFLGTEFKGFLPVCASCREVVDFLVEVGTVGSVEVINDG